MKLLTHNMLTCHVAKCKKNNFPLKIVLANESSIHMEESDMNPDFIRHMIPKIDWRALKEAADSLELTGLPSNAPTPENVDENTMNALHHILMEADIQNCQLVCPNEECKRSYPVVQGVPNLLLTKDEV
ncbi:hypothetical protein SARC_06277 [Sphaeroforma arctica JP610]|uniref:Multifunctional methyltransferase subunit TRM112-like protein n=1 Tax=Sphaeroforma arctica JP610 TaxID=667725 RepID=A0A0L0FX15_9EUKA|nr:hypothetical protein SARC_06277 [Sphaeroforma arctica JP610]KNC81390.1 hypothetical protein SARC_06277 [Sphaeroforma arctica JP610]|eukprot:XP_014155292.1 hypothetical protein SARC_06277 [Sphaeroforma arctica JP610]